MNVQKKQTRFRDDLRRLLLIYALLPLFCALLVVFAVMGGLFIGNIIHRTDEDRIQAAGAFSSELETIEDILLNMQDSLRPEVYEQSVSERAEINGRLYRRINGMASRPQALIYDESEQAIFTSGGDASLTDTVRWQFLHNIPDRRGETASQVLRGGEPCLLMGARLFDEAGEPNGYLCMAMTENGFRKTVASNADDVLITDRFDTVFVGGTHVFTGKFNKLEADVWQANGVKDTPWGLYYISSEACRTYRVYAALPCGDVLRTARFLLLMVLVFFAAMIAAIQISTKRVAQEKTRVIDEIATACDLVSHGNLNTELTISSHDEFQVIAQAYNTMLENVRKSMEKSVKLGRDTAVAQIRQMESQFNPHFLFNTLENIRFMVRLDPNAADAAMVQLAQLMRYSIKQEGMTVSLKEDLRYIESYMSILKMRFGSRLSYETRIPDELMRRRIPKLIVQPILENAVKYGMEKKRELKIEIEARCVGERLEISVRDNGPGIEPEVMETLTRYMENPDMERKTSFGLMNVHDRLRLMYGERYGIRIQTQQGRTTEVVLSLPGGEGETE